MRLNIILLLNIFVVVLVLIERSSSAPLETLVIPGGKTTTELRRYNDSPLFVDAPVANIRILNRGRRTPSKELPHSGEVTFRRRARILHDDSARTNRLRDAEEVEPMLIRKLATIDEEVSDPFEIKTVSLKRPAYRQRIIK
ncbi:unnamed protein product [Bursaphelenchus okinawaensis]|uniref:Uncharacterized protein n=1 Tax=Bursaphelenchus okinawaensis TaxID=465554 RepID=A0A811L7C8_9BILA|nr:unnamed protein product [Bursaphelenchus okinawaensis]CAG9118292.1 unnamed protein product [Bursaphelenchus okinawaensis]